VFILKIRVQFLKITGAIAEIRSEAHALTPLRGALALAHGYVMLELNRQLRRGGDLEQTFEQGIIAYLIGWSQRANLGKSEGFGQIVQIIRRKIGAK